MRPARVRGVGRGSPLAATITVKGKTTASAATDAEGQYTVELFVNNAFDELATIFKFAQCETSVCGGNPQVIANQYITQTTAKTGSVVPVVPD